MYSQRKNNTSNTLFYYIHSTQNLIKVYYRAIEELSYLHKEVGDALKHNLKALKSTLENKISFQSSASKSCTTEYQLFPIKCFDNLSPTPPYLVSTELLSCLSVWNKYEGKMLKYYQMKREIEDDDHIYELIKQFSLPKETEEPNLNLSQEQYDLVKYSKSIVSPSSSLKKKNK